MLYLLLKKDYRNPTLLDVTYPVWEYADNYEADSLELAIDFIPGNTQAEYMLYELKMEGIHVTVRAPNKLEKVWDDSPKFKESIQKLRDIGSPKSTSGHARED